MSRPNSIVVVNESYRKLSETFCQYQKKLGYAPGSYKIRLNLVSEFLHWLECHGNTDITVITSEQIQQYYQYLSERPSKKDGGALSPKTTHGHMQIVRDLFEMLLQEQKIKVNPTSTLKFYYPKEQGNIRNMATQQEIQRLYEVCYTARERAILSLAYGCGLRAGELQNCNIEDVRLREKILIVPKGKGNKRRVIPLSSGVIKDLSNYYYNEREFLTAGRDYKLNSDNQHAFMLNGRGGRMMDEIYNKYLKALIIRTKNKELQDKQITIHNLRHSIATHLLEQGVSVEQVRLFLGHSQLETTQIYTHISRKQLQKLMQ